MNIDSVAARSGAARTTIYRRSRSRDELMTAVLEHVIDPASLAPDLPVAEKLRWVLDRTSDILENRLGPGATAAIIADSDPEFTTAVRARLAVRLSALADLMNLDIKTDRLLGASSGMDNSSTCRTCRPHPRASRARGGTGDRGRGRRRWRSGRSIVAGAFLGSVSPVQLRHAVVVPVVIAR